jgi:hypothetical protein
VCVCDAEVAVNCEILLVELAVSRSVWTSRDTQGKGLFNAV